MHQFFQSTLLTFTLLNKQRKTKKHPRKGFQFLFENYCHDDYFRLIWTINSCREECFKSLRKSERPHNVNSCDKCSCTAGGNGYCNHMFLSCVLIDWIPKNWNVHNSKQQHKLRTQGTTPNSYNAYKVYNVINLYYRKKCSGRNEGFKGSLVCSLATYCPK